MRNKRLRLLCVAVILLLALIPHALAENWTCPKCKQICTGNFCPEDGTAKPTPTPSPVPNNWTCPVCHTVRTGNFCPDDGTAKSAALKASSIKVYSSRGDIVYDQPWITDVSYSTASISFTFDKALNIGSKARVSYYDASGSMQSKEIKITSPTKTITLQTAQGWKTSDYIHLNLKEFDYTNGVRIIRSSAGDQFVSYLSLDFTKSKSATSFPNKPETYMSFMNGGPLYSLTYDGTEFHTVYLNSYDSSGKTKAVIRVESTGKVGMVDLYKDGKYEKTLWASSGDNVSTYQTFANNNMPSWPNADRFAPKYTGSTSTPKPKNTQAPSRTYEISSRVSTYCGHVTVSWTDSDNAKPYKVSYEYADGGTAVQSSFWAGGTESGSTTYSKSFTIDGLIPGRKYIIKVTDKNNKQIKNTIRMPYASDFVDGKLKASSLKVSIEYRYLTSSYADQSKAKSLNRFKANEMMNNMSQKGYEYGLNYKISIPRLAYSRNYDYMIAFYAPNGYAYCYSGNVTFDDYGNASSSWYEWYCLGTFFFDQLYAKNSSIPTGTYTVELYLDGMKVTTNSFRVQ